jgi:hypothetical protein
MKAHRTAWPMGATKPGAALSTGGAADPPSSSAIFTLNPDGTTTVTPALGANGDPVLQPQNGSVPELSSLVLAGVSPLSLVGCGWAAGRLRRSARR